MSDAVNADDYLTKAQESLWGAESECANRRFSNCANRACYAAFQAAISALVREGVRSRPNSHWPHAFVQVEFVRRFINRSHRYPSSLQTSRSDLLELRSSADYRSDAVSEIEARQGLRKSQEFFNAIQSERGKPS